MVLKSYCKGLKVDRDFVAEAYASWLVAPAGRKNGWRVEKDFGGEDALIDEIAGEIATRTLQFEPIRRYEHKEPTNGKVRTIGIHKRDLKMAVRALVKFMREELGFSVKPWKIAKMGDAEPLDLGGYIARDGRVTLRAGLFLRAKRAIARFSKRHTITLARRVCSYWGWLKHSQSLGFIVRNGVHGLMKIARAMISKASIREETCRLLRAQQS